MIRKAQYLEIRNRAARQSSLAFWVSLWKPHWSTQLQACGQILNTKYCLPMRITSRAKTISFFITLGSCLVGVAVYLNISWIVNTWRNVVTLVLGIIFFVLIIAG